MPGITAEQRKIRLQKLSEERQKFWREKRREKNSHAHRPDNYSRFRPKKRREKPAVMTYGQRRRNSDARVLYPEWFEKPKVETPAEQKPKWTLPPGVKFVNVHPSIKR